MPGTTTIHRFYISLDNKYLIKNDANIYVGVKLAGYESENDMGANSIRRIYPASGDTTVW